MTRYAFFRGILLLLIILLVAGLAGAADLCKPQPTAPRIDERTGGTFTSGNWTYKFTIAAKGSKSEGYYGALSFKGEELSGPTKINETVCTPWGTMSWVGDPVTIFGSHGWMLRPRPNGSSSFVSLPKH
jgi:hypothetical protein